MRGAQKAAPVSAPERRKRASPLTRRTHSRRLTRKEQFRTALSCRNVATGRYFVVRAAGNDVAWPRLGVIAGRKAIPRAVDRNRCKRLVREVFHAMRETLAEFDVVVLCRGAVPKTRAGAARRELASLIGATSTRNEPPAAAK